MAEAYLAPEPPARARLLVVEDDPLIRTFCERLLRVTYTVTTASNGREALDALAGGGIDLVLADLHMPLMGGMDLLREVRQRYSDVDVIILTAHAAVDTAREALKLGALDYLSKPVEAENLERTVRTSLELRRVRREKERLSDLVMTYQFSQMIATTLDSEAQVRQIAEFLWRRFTPRTLALSLFAPESQALRLLIARSASGPSPRAEAVPLRLDGDAALVQAHMRLVGGPGTDSPDHFAGAALRIHDRPVGYVHLARGADQPSFDAGDRRMLGIVAGQIAASLDNARLYRSLKDLSRQTIEALAEAIDARDAYTLGHSRQVTRYAVRLAEVLGLPPEQISIIDFGGLLHDVGKIGIRDHILLKPGPLSDEEFAVMKQHPLIGVRILERVRGLWAILPVVRSHHERFDGRGYPDGLGGEEIPLAARIIAVADSFEAMTADRAYRPAMPTEVALNRISEGAGSHWDPQVVEAFVRLIRAEGDQLKVGGVLRQRTVPLINPDTLAGPPDVRD